MATRDRAGRRSREYLAFWKPNVSAEPVAAAEAASQSLLFISNQYLKGIRVAFNGVDCDRRQAQRFDTESGPPRQQRSLEALDAKSDRGIAMHQERN